MSEVKGHVRASQLLACIQSHELPYFIVSLERNHKVHSVNSFASALLRLEPSRIVGRPLLDIFWMDAPSTSGVCNFEYHDSDRIVSGWIDFLGAGDCQIAVIKERKPSESLPGIRFAEDGTPGVDDREDAITLISAMSHALREREATFRAILENAPIPMSLSGIDYHFQRINPAFTRLLGYDLEDLHGKTYRDITHPDDIAKCDQVGDRLRNGETSLVFEKRYITRDGQTLEASVYLGIIRNEQGAIQLIVAQILDLTARKRAEKQRQDAENLFKQFFDSAPIGLVMIQLNGEIQDANKAFADILGLPLARVIGENWQALTHPEDIDKSKLRMSALIEGEIKQFELEKRFLKANGDSAVCVIKVGLVNAPDGKPRFAIAQILDITERRRAAEFLYHQTRSFEEILSNIPVQVALLDRNHTYRFVNPSAVREPELRAWINGRDDFDFARRRGFSKEFARNRANVLDYVIHSKTVTEYEEQGDAGEIYLRRITPILNASGDVKQILATGIEVTDSVRYREELESRVTERTADLISALKKERELGTMKLQFVSMASHEFRTPLATITTACDILLHYRDRLSEEQITKNLVNIQKELQVLTELLNDFLSYGKAEAGRLQFNPGWTRLSVLLKDGVLRTLDPERSDRVLFRSFPADFRVFVDHALIRQVLNNLIENALKYSGEDTRVYVTAAGGPGGVRFRVRDRGIGIEQSELNRIFEPFFRGANVGNRSGTGLGLAISKMSLELHGGRISAKSVPKRGTTIDIHLPFREEHHDENPGH